MWLGEKFSTKPEIKFALQYRLVVSEKWDSRTAMPWNYNNSDRPKGATIQHRSKVQIFGYNFWISLIETRTREERWKNQLKWKGNVKKKIGGTVIHRPHQSPQPRSKGLEDHQKSLIQWAIWILEPRAFANISRKSWRLFDERELSKIRSSRRYSLVRRQHRDGWEQLNASIWSVPASRKL